MRNFRFYPLAHPEPGFACDVKPMSVERESLDADEGRPTGGMCNIYAQFGTILCSPFYCYLFP